MLLVGIAFWLGTRHPALRSPERAGAAGESGNAMGKFLPKIISNGLAQQRETGDVDRQKRTMGDIRTIATAVESYAVDNNMYPDITSTTGAKIEDIRPYIEPIYIKALPLKDGWGNALQYANTTNRQVYSLFSFGKNGVPEGDPTKVRIGTQTNTFDSDIVFSTGSFVQYPEGIQY